MYVEIPTTLSAPSDKESLLGYLSDGNVVLGGSGG